MNWIEFLKNRWFDIRNGYALYLGMIVGFVNLALLVSVKFPTLNPFLFVPLLAVVLGATAAGFGYAHRRIQLKIDQDAIFERSRLSAKVSRILLKAVIGEASREEIEWAKKILAKIGEVDE